MFRFVLRSWGRRLVPLVLGGMLLAPLGATAQDAAGTPGAAPANATPAVAAQIGADDVYADPGGRYTIPVPVGWTAETRNGYAFLEDLDQTIAMSIIVSADPALNTAIASGWARVAPGADRSRFNETAVPPPPGVDELLVLEYDNGLASGRLVQAVGQRVDDLNYVILFDADVDASVRRSSQVTQIVSGLDILAVESVDLTGQVPPPFSAEMLAEFDAYVEQSLADFGIPGAAIAIVQDGAVVYRAGFGVRTLDGDEPMTPETLMMAGSITKSMTTMMMGTLVDDGQLTWDTTAQSILPSFAVADPALSTQITMRNLVCACTGVPRRDLELAFNADGLGAREIIASLADFTFFTPIGEAFQYSNQMVAAGGYLATLAGGGVRDDLDQAYVDLMQARILDPVGMPNSTLTLDPATAPANLASGHQRLNDGSLAPLPVAAERLLDPVEPAVGLWTTADDLARYLQTLLAEGVGPDGNRVISVANLDETLTPQVAVSATDSYGLGWFVGDYHGQEVVYHDGNTYGFTANLTFLPAADFGIVILTNAQQVNLFTEAVRWRLIELAFGQEPVTDELVAFSRDAYDEQIAYTVRSIGPAPAATEVAPLLGTYTNPALGEARLDFADGKFWLDAGEFRSELRPLRGEAAAQGDYIGFDGPAASHTMTFDLDGPVPVMIFRSAIDNTTYRFERITPAASPVADPAATPLP